MLISIEKGYAALETNAILKCPFGNLTVIGIFKNTHHNRALRSDSILVSDFFMSGPIHWFGYLTGPTALLEKSDLPGSVLIKQYLYVTDRDKKKKRKTEKEDEKQPEKERYLLCKQCENKISKPDYRSEIQGAFDHTFLNPSGQVFHIGCFRRADGCVVLGEASSEWTWFQGFHWRVALCGQCLTHLGWFYFNEDESSFFGLILDALV